MSRTTNPEALNTVIAASVPASWAQQLTELAKAQDRSISYEIRNALRIYLAMKSEAGP